jgi:hypothetical protein
MIKIRIIDGNENEKFILLNEDAIVSVEQRNENLFEVYLVDGRILKMTLEMFTEHFEEDEETYS